MVKTYESKFPPSPNLGKVTVCFKKLNNTDIYANLVILATPVDVIGHQVVCLGHLGGFVAF